MILATSDSKIPKVHEKPQISANELAKYIISSRSKREQILRDHKFPKGKQHYYQRAASALQSSFLVGSFDQDRFQAYLEKLEEDHAAERKKKKRETLGINVQALKKFHSIWQQVELGTCQIIRGPQKASLLVQGVKISIRPEIILQDRARGTFGLLKFHFSKKHFTLDVSRHVSSLLLLYGREQTSLGALDPRLTQVVDCFGKEVVNGTRSQPKDIDRVEAACNEIYKQWPLIKPKSSRRF